MPTPPSADELEGLAAAPEVPYPEPPAPTVEWWGERLPLFCHLYNMTWLNERGAELAVVRRFLSEPESDWASEVEALEVGNVLGHYGMRPFDATIVDRYEWAEGVKNLDVFDIDGEYGCIVSVSTLEHVRWDEPEPREQGGAAAALDHLVGLLAPGGRALITVPTGHNPALDQHLATGAGADRWCTLVRDMQSWRQTPYPEFRPYGLTQPWAEGVWIGEWSRPL